MFKLKIGHNPSANMLPMFYFLDKVNPAIELISGVPAAHNRMLAAGEIHMAPISAFSYGEHFQNYSVLPDLSVSAKGKIGSILLYSKFPLADLDGRTVALTNTSATSVNLLKIILEKFVGVKPNYKVMPPELVSMLENSDAALLIADEALMGLAQNHHSRVFDLGEEWHKYTGLPMTFAVWAISDKIALEHPGEVKEVYSLLLAAKRIGLHNLDKIVDHCVTNLGYQDSFWQEYFSQLQYGLGQELLQGLGTYFRYCTDLKLLSQLPAIKVLPMPCQKHDN